MYIYLTSAFTYPNHQTALHHLRGRGFDVFDYRAKVTQAGPCEDPSEPASLEAFRIDKAAMDSCDALVVMLPGGRGAHLEAGYVAGRGKPVFFVGPIGKPELMYMLGTHYLALYEAVDHLRRGEAR